MILYLDTSSLVKLYIDEPYSEEVWQWAVNAYALATSRVAYPEMLSALTRRYRDGDMDAATYQRTVGAFQRDWDAFAVVDLEEIRAGELASTHALRGFDAVHLAAALTLLRATTDGAVAFTSFDQRLNQAAGREGFTVLTPPDRTTSS